MTDSHRAGFTTGASGEKACQNGEVIVRESAKIGHKGVQEA